MDIQEILDNIEKRTPAEKRRAERAAERLVKKIQEEHRAIPTVLVLQRGAPPTEVPITRQYIGGGVRTPSGDTYRAVPNRGNADYLATN